MSTTIVLIPKPVTSAALFAPTAQPRKNPILNLLEELGRTVHHIIIPVPVSAHLIPILLKLHHEVVIILQTLQTQQRPPVAQPKVAKPTPKIRHLALLLTRPPPAPRNPRRRILLPLPPTPHLALPAIIIAIAIATIGPVRPVGHPVQPLKGPVRILVQVTHLLLVDLDNPSRENRLQTKRLRNLRVEHGVSDERRSEERRIGAW